MQRLFKPHNPSLAGDIPETARETIQLYFDIYVTANINRVLQVESSNFLIKLLAAIKRTSVVEFEDILTYFYGETTNREIKSIFRTFHCLLNGNLKTDDYLMATLIKLYSKNTIELMNSWIKSEITKHFCNYFLFTLQKDPELQELDGEIYNEIAHQEADDDSEFDLLEYSTNSPGEKRRCHI